METLSRMLGALPTDDPPARAAAPEAAASAAAFDRLVREQQPRIVRLASRLLGWSADVDDVVQDTFMQAWKAMPAFRGDARPDTWLTRITINLCRSRRRRRTRWWRLWARETAGRAAAADAASQNRSTGADDETLAAVRTAVAALAPADREVLVLRYLEELPAGEVASILNVSRNTLDVRLNRARARLRARLAQWMEPT